MSRTRLAYCSNIHPAETVAGIVATLASVSAKVRDALDPGGRLGVGLWLSNAVVDELLTTPGAISRLKAFLAQERFDVFTLNAFPFGGFHGARVKEKVFEPTWADPRRLAYTTRCAEILAELLEPGATGSISTSPLALPMHAIDRGAAISNLRACGRAFAEIEARTGHRIVLGIEPEPTALLETIDDAIEFLRTEVFARNDEALRRHLGVCFDACHESILHQDVEASLRRLNHEGIVLAKLQLSSALELRDPSNDAAAMERLRAFDEGRYFHQTAYRDPSGRIVVVPDLPDLFELAKSRALSGVEKLRVHFHVPIFATLDAPFATTRDDLSRAVRVAKELDLTEHFEIETYTFDVIPQAERARLGAEDLPALLVREFVQAREWMR